jgi:hypothetical protein
MISEPEREASICIAAHLVGLVEDDGGLSWPAQSSDDAQLAARDHRLVDDDVGTGRRAAQHDDGSHQKALNHHAPRTSSASPSLPHARASIN